MNEHANEAPINIIVYRDSSSYLVGERRSQIVIFREGHSNELENEINMLDDLIAPYDLDISEDSEIGCESYCPPHLLTECTMNLLVLPQPEGCFNCLTQFFRPTH